MTNLPVILYYLREKLIQLTPEVVAALIRKIKRTTTSTTEYRHYTLTCKVIIYDVR